MAIFFRLAAPLSKSFDYWLLIFERDFLYWIVEKDGTDGREKEVGRTKKCRGLRSRSNWSFSGFIFTLIMIILAIIHYHLDHNHDLDHPDHHLQNHVPSWSSSLASSSSSWLTKTRMRRTKMGLNQTISTATKLRHQGG